MRYSLGIHIGHDASCAIVADGRLVAAVQEERISRLKHAGEEMLSNRLPVAACLRAAGITLADVSVIVSSFQSASPGGVGLQHPAIEPGFNLFDPFDRRHYVASHHLAHALCAFGSSGYDDATVLVCDQAGSSTLDGGDFCVPFATWHQQCTQMPRAAAVVSECLSIYDATAAGLTLKQREYGVPHSQQQTFVQNLACLYDNVSRCVFRRENAHGQLMALAAYADLFPSLVDLSAADLVRLTPPVGVEFRNDWQHRVPGSGAPEQYARLAQACQSALEEVLLVYTARAAGLSRSRNLAVAGGVFLNIIANTRLAQSGLFARYFVPSAPHDAGVSVGCAYLGDLHTRGAGPPAAGRGSRDSDRLGIAYPDEVVQAELLRGRFFVRHAETSIDEVAALLADGAIVARWSGRAEFGPRALGGRSMLGSPLRGETKARLNQIKGRQAWRPVAPVIPAERFAAFLSGPPDSPYMSYTHLLQPDLAATLPALAHPDGSTRAQTLDRDEDPWLHQLLLAFEQLTGVPILVNTSLNGAGQPIVETLAEALAFFLESARDQAPIDALALGPWLVRRRAPWESDELRRQRIRLADGALISLFFPRGEARALITRKGRAVELSAAALQVLSGLAQGALVEDALAACGGCESELAVELYRLLATGFVTVVDESETGDRVP